MKKEEFESRLFEYSKSIISFVDILSKGVSSEVIGKQVVRSGTSVTANVAEAKSASSKKDYINFYNHALKSANESLFWLKLASETGKAPKQVCDKIIDETGQIAKILASSIITMRKNLN